MSWVIGREADVTGDMQGGGCQGCQGGSRMSGVTGREEDVMCDGQGGGCQG